MSACDRVNNVAEFYKSIVASSRPETKFLINASVVSDQMERPTEKSHQAQVILSTKSKELVNVAQLKMSIKNFEENVAFYESSKETLNNRRARARVETTLIRILFKCTRAQAIELQERQTAKGATIKSVVQASYGWLGLSIRGFVENFLIGFSESVGEAFWSGSLNS